MRPAWIFAVGLFLLLAWSFRSTVAEMCREEMRTRLGLLPYALIRLAAGRLPHQVRNDVGDEWRDELAFILEATDGLPLTRLIRGTRYAAGLLLVSRGIGRELTDDNREVGYGDAATCIAAGITIRQLDYWARTGLVTPSVGQLDDLRLYSFRDILVLKLVRRLLDTGISLRQIRAAVRHLRDSTRGDLTLVTLMSDGVSIYECTSMNEVVDLLQRGQGMFGIAVGRIWKEVEAALANLPGEPTP